MVTTEIVCADWEWGCGHRTLMKTDIYTYAIAKQCKTLMMRHQQPLIQKFNVFLYGLSILPSKNKLLCPKLDKPLVTLNEDG